MNSQYMCLNCGEVFNSSYLNTEYDSDMIRCPKTNCPGWMIEVDELMIPTIKTLNEKGYLTKHCCSGHYTQYTPQQAYISFLEGIDIPSVPSDFKKEIDDDGCVTIRKDFSSGKDTFKVFNDICDNAKILLKWADNLPSWD